MKFFIIFLLNFILFFSNSYAKQEGCSKVYSSLVFDENSGNILHETRPDKLSYPASLVKLMTLYLTFEALEKNKIFLDEKLIVSQRGQEVAAVNKVNTLKLKEGDKITVKEAIEAVIVKSYNEAAVTLAEAVGYSEWNFVRMMNDKARDLKMYNTSFSNSTGLHEDGQYTTSYDLARLVDALIKDFPQYYHFFSLKEFKYRGTKHESHNYVLLDYKGAEGLKTGFTKMAGFNLVSAAKKKDSRVVSIVMGCQDQQVRDDFTEELLDGGFNKIAKRPELEVKLAKNFDYQKFPF